MGTPGVLIVPLEQEFGWSDAQISSALALRLMLFGLFGPFAAAFMNRYGVRRVIIVAMALISAGLLASLGDDAGVAAGSALGRRRRRRHRTHRDGARGDGGDALVQPSPRPGHGHAGGEQCHRAVGVPAADRATDDRLWLAHDAGLCRLHAGRGRGVSRLLFMRDRPSDLNLPVYGETKITPPPAQGVGLVSLLMSPLNVLKEAARVPIFWVLFATFFVCGCSTNGLIQTHFVTLCHDYGLAATAAASVLAMMGIFDFFGTIGSGWLSDRFDNRWLLFWYYGLRGLSLLYLPFTDFTFYGLSLFAVFYGLDWIATVPPTVKLTARPFRPGEGRHGVRLGLCRPSDRRRQCCVRRRSGPHRIFHLSAGLLRCRRALHHRRGAWC